MCDFSAPSHTMNVDITSQTFTDVNLRYAAQREGVTASISSPSAGLLGFQLLGKAPSQLTSRVYSQYAVSNFLKSLYSLFGNTCVFSFH